MMIDIFWEILMPWSTNLEFWGVTQLQNVVGIEIHKILIFGLIYRFTITSF